MTNHPFFSSEVTSMLILDISRPIALLKCEIVFELFIHGIVNSKVVCSRTKMEF